MNRYYGKIENGKLVYAPNKVRGIVEGREVPIYNPSDYYLRSNGYKSIVRESYPTDGKTYAQNITEDEQNIVIGWRQVVVPEEPTIEDRVDALEDAFLEFIIGG